MMRPRTLFDKLWDAHAIVSQDHGDTLLWIDRHFVHEGSHHAFAKIAARGAKLARPDLTFGVADHYVPTRALAGGSRDELRNFADPVAHGMVAKLTANAGRHGVTLFGLDDRRQGIVHVVGPEQGLTLPGTTVVCSGTILNVCKLVVETDVPFATVGVAATAVGVAVIVMAPAAV